MMEWSDTGRGDNQAPKWEGRDPSEGNAPEHLRQTCNVSYQFNSINQLGACLVSTWVRAAATFRGSHIMPEDSEFEKSKFRDASGTSARKVNEMESEQRKFEGWAVVELLGHGREVGYITTMYFGNQAMFHIESPAIPEREVTLLEGAYHRTKHEYITAGSKVTKAAIPSKTRIVSSASIFAISPSTEDAVRKEIDASGEIAAVVEAAPEPEYPF